MRVLLVNAFHYARGGVERTYFDESRWLESAGHEVGHFAIRDPRNLPSPTARFFAPPAEFGEGTPAARLLAQLPRVIWSAPAERAMEELLTSFRPEVAHLHAPSRHLTPAVMRPLRRAGVPVVMTLHDFKPWCTNRLLFAHDRPCERCRGGRHWHALAVGCVQGSRLKSAVGMVEAYVHDWRHAYDAVRLWIAPTRFVRDRALSFGVPRGRLRRLCHGLEPAAAGPAPGAAVPRPPRPCVLFAGRLSVEKGVRLLPGIARGLGGVPVVVAGEGPLLGELEAARRDAPNLELVGQQGAAELAELRRAAAAVVVPSVTAEIFGYTAAEALLDARPVVAARIGAIPEIVRHERTGLLVEPGDVDGFVAALRRALTAPEAGAWAERGRACVAAVCGPARHLARLLEIYEEARRA